MWRVAFLVSGQLRCASFGRGPDALTHSVVDHLRRNVFNDGLRAHFEYDVFMSVDDADEANARAFFGDHLATLETLGESLDVQVPGFEPSISASNYRIQRAWRAMVAHAAATEKTYDLVVRLRPDVEYYHDLVPCLLALQKHPEKQMVFVWDIAWAGRYGIMEACCNQYDAFFRTLPTTADRDPVFGAYYSRAQWKDMRSLTNIPEFQLAESAMRYVREHGMCLERALVNSRINFMAVQWPRSNYADNNIPADSYARALANDFP